MKRNGDVRICMDLTPLNKAAKREIHPMVSVNENIAKLQGSTVLYETRCKFWVLAITPYEESCLLTAFVIPFWQYCFSHLPFGISSAPEIFQRTMSIILEELEGVVTHMDDILIYGVTQGIHDQLV